MKTTIGGSHYRQMLMYVTLAKNQNFIIKNKSNWYKRQEQIIQFLNEAIEKCDKREPTNKD